MIRSLRRGEPVPTGNPRRYPNSDGYIRLRWKVGIDEYAETYEHRVVDGVVTAAEQVHHRNEVKSDNGPSNLEPMTLREHGLHHKRPRKWRPYRSFAAMWKAAHAENQRFDRDRRTVRMRALRAQGRTTVEIGAALGIHPSAVSRYLSYGRNY